MLDIKWKTDFFKLQEQDNELEACRLKLSNFPQRFYKYRPINQFTFDSLFNNNVYMASVERQNDPYDLSYSVNWKEVARGQYQNPDFWKEFKKLTDLDVPQRDIEEIIQHDSPLLCYITMTQRYGLNIGVDPDLVMANKYQQWRGLVEKERNRVKVSCFSTRNDSILMWSHYAHLHQGICVEYDFKGLGVEEKIQPVQYQESQYDITHRMIPHFDPHDISIGIYIATLTKAKDWEYENEWRIVNNLDMSFHPMPKPAAIYLGVCFDKNDRENINKIYTIGKEMGIPIIQMKIHESKFLVVASEIK